MSISGTVINGVIVLDSPQRLPEGTQVDVVIRAQTNDAESASSLRRRLLAHAGKVSGLPPDLAEQHDHYVHGTPKR